MPLNIGLNSDFRDGSLTQKSLKINTHTYLKNDFKNYNPVFILKMVRFILFKVSFSIIQST